MSNLSKKAIRAGSGMFQTEIVQTKIDVTKPETPESIEAIKDILENAGSDKIFERHISRFKSLSSRILENQGAGVKEDQIELVSAAIRLDEEASFLRSLVKDKADSFFLANQAMLCMNLYHQCAGRLFFEQKYRAGERQEEGQKLKSAKKRERHDAVRERANEIRQAGKGKLSNLQIAKVIYENEDFWAFLESLNLHKKGESLSVETIRKIISS